MPRSCREQNYCGNSQKHYADTIDKIKQGKKDNLQAQLNLQLDKNGLIRCHGRLSNPEPKLLSKKECFTKLVVEYYHQKILHSGVSQTLA